MSTAKKVDDAGAAQVQAEVDKETEQGYVGQKVDPVPNEEYTLVTGPDSPPIHPDDTTRAAQHSFPKES
jgi:hypothetical protein